MSNGHCALALVHSAVVNETNVRKLLTDDITPPSLDRSWAAM